MNNPCGKLINGQKIIASLRRREDLTEIANHKCIKTVFVLNSNLLELKKTVHEIKGKGKNVFVHIDLVEGLGKDSEGVKFLKAVGVNGIITTKLSLIRTAKEEGLMTVQRFFMVDSEAVKTGIKMVKLEKPEAMEILPAFLPKYYLDVIKNELGIPTNAGGLIRTEEDVKQVLDTGFCTVTTSRRTLWNLA
ncbi:MAG: glycerol-3-phosphate responsive antiterminator [Thermincolia bacterium]